MYLIDQAKLKPYKGSVILKRLNLGDWLGVETDTDGRVSIWADVNSSFFGLKRTVREQLGFLPHELSKMLKNNIKNGYCKYFNEYGGIKKEENYKNGKLDGNRKLYNEDGHISDERNYKEGKREGIFWVYYPNGEYQYIDTYKNDKKINRKAYTVEGQLRFDQDYPQ